MKRALIALASLLLLTGCPSNTPPQTVTLVPTKVGWTPELVWHWNFYCAIGANGFSPTDLGDFGPLPGPNETVSGFIDSYDGGTGPAACVNKAEWLYRGYVQFDQSLLKQFDAILAATLKFDVASSLSDHSPDQPPTCAATTFGLATGNDEYDFDEPGSLPAACPPSQYSFDVRSWVTEWISGNHNNYGFILAGPRLDLPSDPPEDNDAHYSFYNNFRLEILYAPDSNCHLVNVPGAGPGPNCPGGGPPRFHPSPPVVSTIDPNSGPAAGGTAVSVTGTGFSGFGSVAFGGTDSSNVAPDPNNPDTHLTADSPAGTGTVDVTVTTPAGTSPPTAADQFNYQ